MQPTYSRPCSAYQRVKYGTPGRVIYRCQIQCLHAKRPDMAHLQSFFQSKQSLEKGTVITLLWRPEGVLEILLRESDEGLDYSRVCTSFHTAAVDLCLLLGRSCHAG
jgi:hypothetical protein